MADVLLLQVPVEVGLELCAVVRLDYEHPEGSRRMTSSTKLIADF
jgi:hypothetical protein